MDLEGYAKQLIIKKDEEAALKLKEEIEKFKNISEKEAWKYSNAILEETKNALLVKGDVFEYYKSGVEMGAFGVGSRGAGDFYIHEKIGKVIGKTSAILDSSDMDDSGVVKINSAETDDSKDLKNETDYIVLTVDGMHSRLSAFPFLAGFHVAKAALRDIYVMGARPSAMLSDIHVADGGDVSVIFDHIAGITAVSELSDIPLITGSTLRIGGDMVIGERMTGCVGAVGTVHSSGLTARNKAAPEDVILMTEGAGGGTITTAAIYSGYKKAEDVIEKTLNIDFLTTCRALLDNPVYKKIHVMTDVTNGGIRGDAYEISKEANVRLVFDDETLRQCVDPIVLEMLETLNVDFRGVSIDSLLIICPKEIAEEVIEIIENIDIKINIVGHVEEKSPDKSDTALIIGGEEKEFKPLFRESAYTPLKKVIGEKAPPDFEAMRKEVDSATDAAIQKKERIVKRIKNKK